MPCSGSRSSAVPRSSSGSGAAAVARTLAAVGPRHRLEHQLVIINERHQGHGHLRQSKPNHQQLAGSGAALPQQQHATAATSGVPRPAVLPPPQRPATTRLEHIFQQAGDAVEARLVCRVQQLAVAAGTAGRAGRSCAVRVGRAVPPTTCAASRRKAHEQPLPTPSNAHSRDCRRACSASGLYISSHESGEVGLRRCRTGGLPAGGGGTAAASSAAAGSCLAAGAAAAGLEATQPMMQDEWRG